MHIRTMFVSAIRWVVALPASGEPAEVDPRVIVGVVSLGMILGALL